MNKLLILLFIATNFAYNIEAKRKPVSLDISSSAKFNSVINSGSVMNNLALKNHINECYNAGGSAYVRFMHSWTDNTRTHYRGQCYNGKAKITLN